MKKVLVTGGCGFLGSHVCEYYIKNGDQVIAFDNMTKYELTRTGYATEKSRNYNWDFLKKLGVILIKGDVRNYEELMEAARGCDFIVHTAAQPAMTISWEDPELDFSTNVRGTFNVLKVAKKLKVPIVSCASIHVYGNKINDNLKESETRYLREPVEIDETYPVMQGILTPLHASKESAELYVQTFIDTYKLEAASFRFTGLYGPRQFGGEDHGWVANFAIRAVLGEPINIYGTGKQLRDILYARDAVLAFDSFYKTRKSGIYNIGGSSKTAISLIECVKLLEEVLGKKLDVNFLPDRHGDLRYFVCDTKKAKKDLDWQAEVLPKEGVTNLVNWIKENQNLFKK
ncbi:MAG: nucleoside-diphosphate sugar epimerase [Candidatus Staskawiczbacteria bacterium RIFOXYB1_FULL_37_44]|uniref:Nucleoside-diphosphate sugar epimerase n=1 Tax=Candidatus Staskawiczbacteria bacterium RIFOXYB1_FULL_37_44 TaxID=1802223 RepID=A0A1G2IY29_9BACT|nr:MAG: nucleoside-diphosphate sugar epimerase [Candidatus Staskawiczbacteria bacterium RIFOXYB1_FULL_37_44]OGZ83372.1 MAG: nucleoside-diphosphate sugar epimerase [Candidatus Staskawiczbacteria bacterium RIFOXYC1_FULL_37_52]OGZ86921.1 MAG: nucleoside-diphosphate sugar epimerase [Candidatus Staskawiczbacteria bacterium RIFOXYC2_FULL_37_19]OGZ88775.1 MAG: nucleoside-diphosphate sugar epimerase [Candidatus Staskawiczbacteria bacterium RIFOXYD1_FULL_37_110]